MTSIFLVGDHEIFAKALLRVLRERVRRDVFSVAQSAEESFEQIPNLELTACCKAKFI